MVKRSAELWLINVTGKSVVLWLKQMGLNMALVIRQKL
ncbi:Uncharacterised protein [Klebsiella michiganensis]|nr:Uncharacterised protein [Klebsiella michiganensis]